MFTIREEKPAETSERIQIINGIDEDRIKERKRKDKAIEKTGKDILEEKLKAIKDELAQTKKQLEGYKKDREMIDEVEKKVTEQVIHFETSIAKAKNLLKMTQPLHIIVSHTRKRNLCLQVEKRNLQRQVKELKEEMELMKTESKKGDLEREIMKKTV